MELSVFDKAKNHLIERIALEMPEGFVYNLDRCLNGWKISFSWCDGDFVCHSGSYGGNQGYWEAYHFIEDGADVTGWMDDDAVLKRMRTAWDRSDRKEEVARMWAEEEGEQA